MDYTDEFWLRGHYWGKELTSRQIATLVSREKSTILYWMEKHNIPRRNGGHLRGGKVSPEIRRRMSVGCRGRKHSLETRRKMSEGRRGSKNANWKGGVYKSNRYIKVFVPKHLYADVHGYMLQHRLVMEKYLG